MSDALAQFADQIAASIAEPPQQRPSGKASGRDRSTAGSRSGQPQ
jgi:hypothetical protein